MQNIRAVFKLILFFCVVFFTVILIGIGRLIILNKTSFLKWKNRVTKNFAKSLIVITGMDLEVEGTVPEPPFFLVSNHLSYLDILPIWFCCECTFIAKREVSKWPFIGLGAKSLGIIFIDRENNRDIRRVNKLISEQLKRGQGVVLFPEGTSTKGDKVLPFNPSLLFYPAYQEIPVSYATIFYRSYAKNKPAAEYICWWGDMTFFKHLFKMLKLKGFYAKLSFGKESMVHNNRKILATELHQKVEQNLMARVNEDYEE